MENVLGLIKLRIKRGIDLKACDTRSSDPYVFVTMVEQELKTGVVKNNCNPEWNEELTLYVKDVNNPIHLIVSDKDTFTVDDNMGDTEIDLKPYLRCVKMELSNLPDGHVIKIVYPDRTNCLAEESSCVWKNGKIVQEMSLRLRNAKSGIIVVEIEWVSVPNSKGLSNIDF